MKNEINNHEIKQEKLNTNENENITEVLNNELKISEEKIEDIISMQNKEIIQIQNRLNNEIKKHKHFYLEKLITEFLSIIDNIERAFNLIKQKKEKKYTTILKNIEHIFSLIENIFNEFKISKINNTEVPFNPEVHQAISVRYTNDIESNQVLEVMQSGYLICNSRLLRPAMVVVSKNKNHI